MSQACPAVLMLLRGSPPLPAMLPAAARALALLLLLQPSSQQAAAGSGAPDAAFAAYKRQHNRRYASADEERAAIAAFSATVAEIRRLRAEQPHADFGLNQFSDYTAAERGSLRCGIGRKCPGAAAAAVAGGRAVQIIDTHWDGRCTACKRFPEVHHYRNRPQSPMTRAMCASPCSSPVTNREGCLDSQLAKGIPLNKTTNTPEWDWQAKGAVTSVKTQG